MAGWAGLVTNASPYALPEGAATEQTNLNTLIPGQLTSRGGMQPVLSDDTVLPEIRDFYPYVVQGGCVMIALTASGDIETFASPVPGPPLTTPELPELAPTVGQVQSNYVGTFYDYAGEPPA